MPFVPATRRWRPIAVLCSSLLPILTACAFICYGQQALAQEYVFRSYRQAQGLENLSVNSLAKDQQGFLWASTENGVYRFLGSSFQRFGAGLGGIVEQDMKEVFAAPDGTLWVAGDVNLYRWTGQSFQGAYTKPIVALNSTSIASEGPGYLLLVSHGELYRLRYGPEGRSFSYERFFSPELLAAHRSLAQLGSITVSADGTFWMACGRMLCSWRSLGRPVGNSMGESGVLTEWAQQQGVPPDLYLSILQDRRGGLWAVGKKHIVELPHASDRLDRTFIDRSLPETAGSGVYNRLPIACDPMGRIIVSLAGGIGRWNGSEWHTIGKANGLNSTHLTAFLFDANGSLWMGSSGHGLHHWIGYSEWEGWTDHQGLPSSNIWSIGPFIGKRLWVGTEKGPAIVNSQNGLVTLPSSAKNWSFGQVTGMIAAPGNPDNGSYLISTASGALLKVDGHPARTTLVADLKRYIYGLLQDYSGRTFAMAGSVVLDASTFFQKKPGERRLAPPTVPRPPLPLAQIDTLMGSQSWVFGGCTGSDGTVWFGSANGIVRLSRDANQDHWSRPSLQGLPNPLPRLSSLVCAKDGGLWLVIDDFSVWHLIYEAGEGAMTAQGIRAGRLKATPLVLPKALQTISPVHLFVDPRGWLWMATDDGLLVWNGSAWRHLTQEDGLIWNDLNAGNMASGLDGSIWAGTSGGISRILHPERLFETAAPQIAIIEARIGNRLLPAKDEVEMPWSRQDLSFEFAAPDALSRDDLVFNFRIAGLQSDWVESRDETAHFQAVPPGVYAFEVFAQDSASGARSEKAIFRFRVRPPWWRTLWFYALCGCSVLLGVGLIFRLRIRHLVVQHRRLEDMVLERTSQLEESREELRRQATHDGLTGLLNRVAVLEAFGQEMVRSSRDATPLTVVLADIDDFKKINDTHGHLAGDEALRQFSKALAGCIRPYDHAGRYGGEEFLLVLVAVDSSGVADRLATLHRCISGIQVNYDNADFVITCSLGVAQLERYNGPADQNMALATADKALYEAKRAGRNRFVFGKLSAGKDAAAPN